MRADSHNTGIASEYYILSKLYRLELEAYLTQGKTKSVDIRVIRPDGIPITIDVKSVRGYSSLVVNNVKNIRNHFIAFVIYNNKFQDIQIEPEVFIVPSFEVYEIMETYNTEKRVLKGKLLKYKDKWEILQQDFGDNGFHTLEELENLDKKC